jgi:YVTN family beta-propeller protein
VLDGEGRSVTLLDVASGAVVRQARLEGAPTLLLRTPDGQRLLALDRGQGKDAGDAGFKATTRSAVTILNAGTLQVLARLELGWGLDAGAMVNGAGTRLSVICTGYAGKTAEESRPRELVTVDLATNRVAGRLTLPRRVAASFDTPDGERAVLLSQREEPKGAAALPAELRIVSLAGPAVVATVPLEGDPRDPVPSFDGRFVYLLDRGHPSGNPEKNVNGRIHIVSMAPGASDTLADAGSKPQGFVLDESGHRLLLLSDRAPAKGAEKAGELRVLTGSRLLDPIPLPAGPSRIFSTRDGGRLFVISQHYVTPIALADLKADPPIKVGGVGSSEPTISPDGRRLYTIFQQDIYTHDLESGREIGKATTGRTGKKLLLALEAATFTATSKSSARREAEREGRSYYQYTEYSVRDADPTMALGPDGKALYALNHQTGDVTVIDALSGQVIQKVGADGFGVYFLPAAATALVVDTSKVHAIDLATHQKAGELASEHFGDSRGFKYTEVSPDGKYAVIDGPGGVLTVSGASGKAVASMHAFEDVADVVIAWGE